MIYTTNAIESVNMSLRKTAKNRGAFPSDEALLKTVLPGTPEYQQKMVDADSGLEGRAKPLYHPVQGPDAATLTETRLHKNPDTLQLGQLRVRQSPSITSFSGRI